MRFCALPTAAQINAAPSAVRCSCLASANLISWIQVQACVIYLSDWKFYLLACGATRVRYQPPTGSHHEKPVFGDAAVCGEQIGVISADRTRAALHLKVNKLFTAVFIYLIDSAEK